MSKSMMEAYIKAQHAVLTCKDNKERLRYTVAGIKDGKFYDHSGTDYGMFDENAPDTVFIPESDLELSRITGTKLAGITLKMQKFFESYNTDEDVSTEDADEPKEKKAKKSKSSEADAEASDEEPEIDTEAVEKAVKKAIKKSDFKKAQKLIDKLGGHKKLQKKLDKAQ